MNEIKRWDFDRGGLTPQDDGNWVRFADHASSLAAAVQAERERVIKKMMEPLRDACKQALQNLDPFQAWLDVDRLNIPLGVRARRPGDAFKPLGRGGHSVKLSDLMVNLKLPRRARPGWPLLLSGDEIIWVPGLRLGEDFIVMETTQRIVKLALWKKASLPEAKVIP